MALLISRTIVAAAAAYGLVGLLFALTFIVLALRRFDPAAAGSSIAFRLIIIPGVAALWPVILVMWLGRGREAPDESSINRPPPLALHRLAWFILAPAVAIALIVALAPR